MNIQNFTEYGPPVSSNDDVRKAYTEGFTCAMNNDEISDNPYKPKMGQNNTQLALFFNIRSAWQSGFIDGKLHLSR